MTAMTPSPLRFTPPTRTEHTPREGVGRPEVIREQLAVPGQPAAAAKRPAHAPGRIPIATLQEGAAPATIDSEAIQREVESSKEYQALKRMGYIREPSGREGKPVESAETAAESDTTTTQGRVTSLQLEVRQELHIEIRLKGSIEQAAAAEPRRSDPLALDLDGDGLETSGIENGVQFDIDGDGRLDQTSFVTGGDAFLALDANGNGRIDSGRELFGDQNGDANGYQALARFDDNGDGLIDPSDTIYQQLRLFTQQSDGSQQLRTLAEEGVASISLHYSQSAVALNQYDTIAQLSGFERSDGSRGVSGDLLLGYRSGE